MSRSQYPVRFVTALELRQQEGAEQGDTFTESPGEVPAETTDDENDPGWSGQGTPGQEQVSNDNSESNSHKSTDDTRRTDLRAVDDHGSWRAVYRACDVDWRGHR